VTKELMDETPRYTITRRDNASLWLLNDDTAGNACAFAFSSAAKAQDFIDARSLGDEWLVKHFTDDRLIGAWMGDLAHGGVRYVFLDSDPGGAETLWAKMPTALLAAPLAYLSG
jgi:hypothetical protein